MKEPQSTEAAGKAGASAPAQLWAALNYPDEATFNRIVETHSDVAFDAEHNAFRSFFALPPWIRLGWPSLEMWTRAKNWPKVANLKWADMQATYPAADLERVMRYWPDCFGQPLVPVQISYREGITLNDLNYGPGDHRVPAPVAATLRHIDQAARREFINQFIPQVHQERVIATLSGTGGGSRGEIRQ